MGLSPEFGIGPEKEAAIVDYFREADRIVNINSSDLFERVVHYMEQFGRINFAALEQIFRAHNFNTHHVAVRSALMEQKNPGSVAADVNAFYFDNKIIRVAYVVATVGSLSQAQNKAREYGMEYHPVKNLEHLKVAGDLVQKPIERRGIIVVPYSPS